MLNVLQWVWNKVRGVAGGPVKVMLVDDSAFVRTVVGRKLDQLPYVRVVASAADVEEAFDLLSQERPDVIILDLEMPGGSGLELLENLSLRERKRCVLLTALGENHPYVERGLKLGAFAVVHKCPDPALLHRTLQEVGSNICKAAGLNEEKTAPAPPALGPLRLHPA